MSITNKYHDLIRESFDSIRLRGYHVFANQNTKKIILQKEDTNILNYTVITITNCIFYGSQIINQAIEFETAIEYT